MYTLRLEEADRVIQFSFEIDFGAIDLSHELTLLHNSSVIFSPHITFFVVQSLSF